MSLYLSFGIVTLLSTVSGLVIFSILFNRRGQPISDRIGAGFAGAFLGTLAGLIAYFAESDRSFRVSVTDAGMLHGYGFSLPQSVTLSVKSRSRWRETQVMTARITAFPACVAIRPRAALYALHAARDPGSHRPTSDRSSTHASCSPPVGW